MPNAFYLLASFRCSPLRSQDAEFSAYQKVLSGTQGVNATLACKKLQAVLTRPLEKGDGLCHLQLNSFKVTLYSVAGLTSLYNQVCTNITP
ncbi:MAG: hypothetical protein EAZ88_10360 [Oscillatoriales cyanobacterium]|nr:MAG: hypothetical protein EAZ88_10360 [Oscillatoriales cyanobacterium]